MAHYAKVESGIVTKVIVAEPEFFDTFVDDSPGKWVKTSFNMFAGKYLDENNNVAADQSVITGDEARERKNFAGVGFSYDGIGFAPPQSYPSWVFDSDTYTWNPPIANPQDGKPYKWDEALYQSDNTKGWVEQTA